MSTTISQVQTAPAVTEADPVVPRNENLPLADWLFRSSAASWIWLVARCWLGYQWFNAGYQKIWGSEKLGFWYNGGGGVYGFAKSGVIANHTPYGAVGYGWWAAFLHNFVMPNASWIAKLVALSEIAIGVGLILGLFTGIVAFTAVALNFIYMMTGSAGVNPMYGLVGILLVMAWRNAGLIGLDRWVLPALGTPFHAGTWIRKVTHHQPQVAAVTH